VDVLICALACCSAKMRAMASWFCKGWVLGGADAGGAKYALKPLGGWLRPVAGGFKPLRPLGAGRGMSAAGGSKPKGAWR
jgi:hypothetical protein